MAQVLANLEGKYSILYIEDNPAHLRLVTKILGYLPNFHILGAHESILGIDLAIEHKPDLILLDINLPDMNGFEVLKYLRQNDVTSEIPVIAISANAMHKDIQKSLDAGFDNYIVKPIDITVLMRVVDKQLSGTYL